MLEVELPYPPSINHYWRRVGPRTLISREGRRFRREVMAILAALRVQPLAGSLTVWIDVYPPDRRRRDLDNIIKSLLDALEHGNAYHDDSQIDSLFVQRQRVVPKGKVRVILEAPNDEASTVNQQPRDAQMSTKPRTCLKCQELFDSAGPGNRICEPCARINARVRISETELKKQCGRKRLNGEVLSDE